MRSIRISTLIVAAACCLQAASANLENALRLQQAGDYAAAADAYQAFLATHPDEPGAHSNLGVVLVKLGRYDEAITQYEAAARLIPGDPRIDLNLALAFEKSGRLTEAATKLATLHAAHPEQTQVTLLLADCYLQTGEDTRVIDLLKPLDSTNLATAYLLGTALIRQKQIDAGQVLLDRILRNGDTAEARFLLGQRMFESGDYPAAVKQLGGAVELNSKLPRLQAFYGLALLNTGDPDAAASAFHAELAENPVDFDANLGLGEILTARNRCTEAVPLLTRAAAMRPQSGEAQAALAECRTSHPVHSQSRLSGGPAIGRLAPDFTLPRVKATGEVSLASFRGKSPVVLVFGSYTCPNFRDAAPALRNLHSKYSKQAAFLLIYIREAHAAGDWQSTRNDREGIVMNPAANMDEKTAYAIACVRKLNLDFPALTDGMDGAVEKLYAAWPSRAYVLDRDGRVIYATQLTELDFRPGDMEAALRSAIAGKSQTGEHR